MEINYKVKYIFIKLKVTLNQLPISLGLIQLISLRVR